MSKLYRDCKHGQLARQCPHCENETMESEIETLRAQVAALEARLQKPVAYEISHDSPADIPHYKGADVFTADKIAAYESHGFIVRPLTYTAPVPAQPAVTKAVAKDAEAVAYLTELCERIDKHHHVLMSGGSAKLLATFIRAILSATATEGRKDVRFTKQAPYRF